jgi:hypothetical protein
MNAHRWTAPSRIDVNLFGPVNQPGGHVLDEML